MTKKKTTTKTPLVITDGTLPPPRTLHERLLAAWEEASYVHRDAAAGNWTAASYDAVVGKLRPYLLKHRILVYPDDHSFRVTPNGNSLLVEAGLRFVNADDPKDFIVVPSCCQGTKNGPGQEQLAGALQTYCYKSALKYAFLLKTGDDPDLEARPSVDVPPQVQAMIGRIRELAVKLPGVQDVEAYIRDQLIGLCERYSHATVRSIEGLAEPVLNAWLGEVERKVEEATGESTNPLGGNEADVPESSGNTFDPEPEPGVELKDGTQDRNPPKPETEDVSKIPPRDRGAKIIGWLSNQRGHIGQVTIRHAFSGWMHENEYDRKLTDVKKWQQIWDRREEILADLDERVEAKP